MHEGDIRNLIRVGNVSSVNEENGTVRVIFDDKNNMVSNELQLLDFEYNIPDIGEQVLCIFLPNGLQQGFCIGSFFSEVNIPSVKDKDIYLKKFDDNTSIKFDKKTKTLTLNGTITVIGSMSGNIQGLTGPQGPQGEPGQQGQKGDTGPQGAAGPKPGHQWQGTSLSFENPDGTYDLGVNLQGTKGEQGVQGPPGSDAAVTKDNIITALGYTPSNNNDIQTALENIQIGFRNYISWGDCESGNYPRLADVVMANLGTCVCSTDHAYTGTKSFKFTTDATTGSSDRFIQLGNYNLNGLIPGQPYTASAMVYIPSGQGINLNNVFISLWYSDGTWHNITSRATINDGWQKLITTMNIPASATIIMIRLYLQQDISNVSIYWDNIKLEVGEKATDWSANPDDSHSPNIITDTAAPSISSAGDFWFKVV